MKNLRMKVVLLVVLSMVVAFSSACVNETSLDLVPIIVKDYRTVNIPELEGKAKLISFDTDMDIKETGSYSTVSVPVVVGGKTISTVGRAKQKPKTTVEEWYNIKILGKDNTVKPLRLKPSKVRLKIYEDGEPYVQSMNEYVMIELDGQIEEIDDTLNNINIYNLTINGQNPVNPLPLIRRGESYYSNKIVIRGEGIYHDEYKLLHIKNFTDDQLKIIRNEYPNYDGINNILLYKPSKSLTIYLSEKAVANGYRTNGDGGQ